MRIDKVEINLERLERITLILISLIWSLNFRALRNSPNFLFRTENTVSTMFF